MKPLLNFKPRRADEWTELIFEHRHKDYGAYALRRDYDRNMLQSLLLTVSGVFVLFLLLSRLVNYDEPLNITLPEKGAYDPGQVEVETPLEKPNNQPTQQPPKQNTNANLLVTNAVDSTSFNRDTTAASTNPNGSTGNATTTTGGSATGGNKISTPDTATVANTIFEFPQFMPEFPGGSDAMLRYLSKRIRCQAWQENGESGTVVLSLVIDRDGRVTDVSVLRDNVGYGCAEQAAQVVREMPRWSPGRMGERAVSVRYILPVQYQRD